MQIFTLKKQYLLLLPLLLMGNAIMAQTPPGIIGQDDDRRVITTAVPFLSITPDARAAGMGDAGAATSADANSVHWNPAKLAFNEYKGGFAMSYSPWLSKIINDMSLSYLSGYYKISQEQAVAVSMRYFDLGEIFFTDNNNQDQGRFNPKEFAIDASYARKLTKEVSIGVTARYIHSNLTGNFSSSTVEAKPGNSAAVDISVFYIKEFRTSEF